MNILFAFIALATMFSKSQNKALVSVPVADLVLKPYGQTQSENSVLESYKKLVCGDICCERAYQLIFNEIVLVEEYLGLEAKIRVPHIIYYDSNRKCYDNSYWTLKSNLIPISKLVENNIDLEKIPKPISWNRSDLLNCSLGVATLVMPFEDPATKIVYSAGTRFVINTEFEDKFEIWIFDESTFSLNKCFIPKDIVKIFENKPMQERINDFVNLLRKWTKFNEGFIPYVFSGSSFTSLTNVDDFKSNKDNNGCAFYWRDEYADRPYAGFDCSCIISRAAQVCGLAYFYKDSQTLVRNLDPIEDSDNVKEGDIIWFPGHVMIVSDVKNNLLIESRGYAAGFGKTHEIELKKAFSGIETYDDLKKAHLDKHKLKLLARDGSLRYVIEEFKILKFDSYAKFLLRYSAILN